MERWERISTFSLSCCTFSVIRDRRFSTTRLCDINNADRLIKYLNNNNIKFSKNFEEKLFVKAYVVDEQKLKNDLDYVNFS